jgi:gliding motility-associated-like protein
VDDHWNNFFSMTKSSFFLIIFSLFSNTLIAQFEGINWYLRDSIGIRFKDNSIQNINFHRSKNNLWSGSAVASDEDGQLIFYTDGESVFNKNHEVMENGDSLVEKQIGVLQSSIILRQPQTHLYYVFSMENAGYYGDTAQIFYAIVNPYDNNGLGRVIQKRTKILNGSCNAITAIKKSSSDDYIIAIPQFNSKLIYFYNLNNIGFRYLKAIEVGEMERGTTCAIKFSYCGTYLALAQQSYQYNNIIQPRVYIMDFDIENIHIKRTRFIDDFSTYSIEFSTNEKFIYVMGQDFYNYNKPISPGDSISPGIYQVVVDSINNKKLNSRYSSHLYHIAQVGAYSMHLTPKNEIFLNLVKDGMILIKNINYASPRCTVENNILDLSDRFNYNIPNYALDQIFGERLSPLDTLLCSSNSINFNLKSTYVDSVLWDFGDGINSIQSKGIKNHTYSDTGNFDMNVKVYRGCKEILLSSSVSVNLPPENRQEKIFTCASDNVKIDLNISDIDSLIWNDDVEGQFFFIRDTTLFFQLHRNGCKIIDSVQIFFTNCDISPDTVCFGSLEDIVFAGQNFDSIKWHVNEVFNINSYTNTLKYFFNEKRNFNFLIEIYRSGKKLEVNHTIKVVDIKKQLEFDSIVSCQDEVSLKAIEEFYDFEWSNGDNRNETEVGVSGWHTLLTKSEFCERIDSFYVKLDTCNCLVLVPNAFTPNGDRLNQVFRPLINCDISDMNLKVFNRWGELIFVGNEEGWDGRYKNKPCQDGVYFWIISYRDRQGIVEYKNGTVHLMR